MNNRRKGQRTLHKALRYALSFPGTAYIVLYQAGRFATPQPCDLIVARPNRWLRLVEVRTNAYGLNKSSTKTLAAWPGWAYHKQIWRFKDRAQVPEIREWTGERWVWQDNPWEEE